MILVFHQFSGEHAMATATIPLTVDPEADELVAELGMRSDLERMLDRARQTIPGLLRLHVVFGPPYDTGPEPSVVIEAYRDPAHREPDDQVWNQFSRWKTQAFSPDVYRHFTLLIMDETNHVG
jgi:hypothetical protein